MARNESTTSIIVKRNPYFSTLEIIYFAILGMMGGVISTYVPIVDLLRNALPPPNPLTQLLGGHHLIWMALAFGLTRKHGAATSTSLIKGFLEFMVGSRFGVLVILLNMLEGISLEAGFFLTRALRERGKNKLAWAIAGGIGNITQPPFTWLIQGRFFVFPLYFMVLACLFAFVSGVVLSGLLSLSVLGVLNKAGIGVKNTPARLPSTPVQGELSRDA